MKKLLLFFSLILFVPISSYSAEPLVRDTTGKYPIKFTWDELPAQIGKPVQIKLKYEWRNWSKEEFEAKQKAAGKIKYTFSIGKFAGGRHKFGGRVKFDIKDKGDFIFWSSSVLDDKGNYGTGKGRVFVNFYCSYKGKDKKKHKGKIGGMTINTTFVAPR